jgi:hypothetical protein
MRHRVVHSRLHRSLMACPLLLLLLLLLHSELPALTWGGCC